MVDQFILWTTWWRGGARHAPAPYPPRAVALRLGVRPRPRRGAPAAGARGAARDAGVQKPAQRRTLSPSDPAFFSRPVLPGRCGRGDKAELLQHHQPVKHQIERGMLTVAITEHLGIVHFDGASPMIGRRNSINWLRW